MFEKIDFDGDIEEIIKKLETNCAHARTVQKQIRELEIEEIPQPIKNKPVVEYTCLPPTTNESQEEITDIEFYIEEYRKLAAEEMDTFVSLLPSQDSLQFERIILRLQAESIREIKEMIEFQLEEPENAGVEDIREFIRNENRKKDILAKLLDEEEIEEEKKEYEESREENRIVLVPNKNAKIRIFDEIEDIPQDFYEEISELIESIINGKFKRIKRINTSTNALTSTVLEVRGSKTRLLFQRIDRNTYAIFSVFMKKTTNDKGYQELLQNRIGDYGEVEHKIKANIYNPEFMNINEQLVQELWNKLGRKDGKKIYRKDMVE